MREHARVLGQLEGKIRRALSGRGGVIGADILLMDEYGYCRPIKDCASDDIRPGYNLVLELRTSDTVDAAILSAYLDGELWFETADYYQNGDLCVDVVMDFSDSVMESDALVEDAAAKVDSAIGDGSFRVRCGEDIGFCLVGGKWFRTVAGGVTDNQGFVID